MSENGSYAVKDKSFPINSHLLTPESITENFIVQAHSLEYKGKRFFFDIEGCLDVKIKPILFLNGAFQNRKSWKKFVKHFKEDTICITTDLPGMGEADTIDEDTPFDFQAECINEILQDLGVEEVNMISASFGSPIAIKFAQMYPQRIHKNIITGPLTEAPNYVREKVYTILKHLKTNDMQAFTNQVVSILLNSEKTTDIEKHRLAYKILNGLKSLSDNDKNNFSITCRRLLTKSVYTNKNSILKETLIFTGEFDHFTSPEYCLNIAKLFKDVLFTTIKRADHMYHIEQFDTMLFLLDSFFKNKFKDLVNNQNINNYNITGEKWKKRENHTTSPLLINMK